MMKLSLPVTLRPVAALFPVVLLSACASTPAGQSQPPATLDGMQVVQRDAGTPRHAPGIDQETLYRLLVAEIAGQRDELDVSVEHYRELALQTRDPRVIERAIRIAVYARNDEAAADIARLWLEIEPGNTDAHQVLAAVAIRREDVGAAVSHLESILQANEGVLDQKLWLIANMLSREKDKDTTLAVMKRLVADYQDNPDALFAYAHVAVRMGDMDRAEQLMKQVLALQPQNINAAMNYISVLRKNDKLQTAINWLEQNLEDYNDNFNLRLVYARLLTDARQFDASRAQFKQLVEADPDNTDVLYALGLLSLQSNNLDEAATYFQRLINLGERQPESRYYLGRIAEEQGRLQAAETHYATVEGGDNYMDAQTRMGLILAKQGRVDEALRHLHNIESENEADERMLLQARAEILLQQQRHEEALELYNQALAENPRDMDLLYSRAMLAEKMDKLDLLESDLRAILEQDPDHAQALNALGYTLADRTDRLQEAHDLIKRALKASPNDFYILDSMGWVLYRMGRLEEAVTYLRKALDKRNDPEVAAHLGEVLWVKGKREEAREIWETALQATPDDERLLDVIKRFNP